MTDIAPLAEPLLMPAAPGAVPYLFDAGEPARAPDLIGRFCREDARSLDWLGDFLQDASIDRLVRALQEPIDETEEEEEYYNRDYLTTTGQDMAFDE
jgi:hypothetical protein